jgi:hypothetical protein
MTEYVENNPTPVELIENCLETSVEYMETKPSAWNSLIFLLDEYNAVNGNWSSEEHNSFKRFLRGFTERTISTKDLPHYKRVTVDWLINNQEEDIGEISQEETKLMDKWCSIFVN